MTLHMFKGECLSKQLLLSKCLCVPVLHTIKKHLSTPRKPVSVVPGVHVRREPDTAPRVLRAAVDGDGPTRPKNGCGKPPVCSGFHGLPFGAILHFHVSSRECKPSIPGSLSLETWSPGIGDES